MSLDCHDVYRIPEGTSDDQQLLAFGNLCLATKAWIHQLGIAWEKTKRRSSLTKLDHKSGRPMPIMDTVMLNHT